MPELPEVETIVRDLRAHGMENAKIRNVDVRWARTVTGLTPEGLNKALKNRSIRHVARRAKFIVFTLDTGSRLLLHLRMTGKLRFAVEGETPGPHDHVTITFADGKRLVFNDTRKFGRFRFVPIGADPLGTLGPEPLNADFTPEVLHRQLCGRKRLIKPLLLDQTTVAGLGNIYVDESLWQAQIHPERRADTLTAVEIRNLHHAIREVLKRGIKNNGTTLGNGQANFYSVSGHRGRNADALKVFRRDGLPCPRCGTRIERSVVGQRGTHFCPHCQKV